MDLSALTLEEKRELLALWEAKELARRRNWLSRYTPYPKQREFHDAGSQYRERMFMASNQSGKTYSGAAEWAFHLTGRYPEDWKGYRFPRPVTLIAGSETYATNKKGVQRLLLGPPEDRSQWGTGAIPYDCIVRTTLVQGVQDAVDSVTVRHVSGENSILKLLSYDQGRTKWQADTVDGVWFDEEPPLDIYTEGMTRTNVTGGPIVTTFTPLLGASAVVRLFLPIDGDRAPFRALINMTIDDALHYTPEQRAAIIAQYPEHEREARAFGRPVLGSGMVFPVADSAIVVAPFRLPEHWPRIVGLDFGWDHPTAAVWLAHDVDTDTLYLYKDYRERAQVVSVHAVNIRAGAPWVPVAWPHDGYQHDKIAGKQIREIYNEAGLNMLPRHATFNDNDQNNYSFEAGIAEMLDRMQTGRWKVFSTCEKWLQEKRGYHRKDGLVVKLDDDAISASRIAMMMRRHARTVLELRPDKAQSGPFVSFGVLDETTGY